MEPLTKPQIEPKTNELMSQMTIMENLAEEILSSKSAILNYETRKTQNKDALSALTHGEVGTGIL